MCSRVEDCLEGVFVLAQRRVHAEKDETDDKEEMRKITQMERKAFIIYIAEVWYAMAINIDDDLDASTCVLTVRR